MAVAFFGGEGVGFFCLQVEKINSLQKNNATSWTLNSTKGWIEWGFLQQKKGKGSGCEQKRSHHPNFL